MQRLFGIAWTPQWIDGMEERIGKIPSRIFTRVLWTSWTTHYNYKLLNSSGVSVIGIQKLPIEYFIYVAAVFPAKRQFETVFGRVYLKLLNLNQFIA